MLKRLIILVQKLFGHPVQETLPAHRRSISQKLQKSTINAEKQAKETQYSSTLSYFQHASKLSLLKVDNHAVLQHPVSKLWKTYRTTIELGSNQKYLVKTKSGRVPVQNRRFIRK